MKTALKPSGGSEPSARPLAPGMTITASVSTVVVRAFFSIGGFSCLVAGRSLAVAPIFPTLAPGVKPTTTSGSKSISAKNASMTRSYYEPQAVDPSPLL